MDGHLVSLTPSASLTAPGKGLPVSGFLLAKWGQYSTVNGESRKLQSTLHAISMRLAGRGRRCDWNSSEFLFNFKRGIWSPSFLPRDCFPTKGEFPCTYNSAILGQPNEKYFNLKILANYQEGSFRPSIGRTISNCLFFLPPCLSSETSRAQLLCRCELPRLTNNGDFFFLFQSNFLLF